MVDDVSPYRIRKWHLQIEEMLANESGMKADGAPLRKIVVAAVVENPYAGFFSQELDRIVAPSGSLGEEFGRRVLAAADRDDLKQTGRQDDSRINIEQDHEVNYWSEKLGVSQDELRKAVQAAGPMVKDVQRHLNR